MVLTADDVGFGGFFGEEIGAVEVAIDEGYFWVYGCYLGAFVRVADEGCDFVFGVGIDDGFQGIATDVARGSRNEYLRHAGLRLGFIIWWLGRELTLCCSRESRLQTYMYIQGCSIERNHTVIYNTDQLHNSVSWLQ